jgi:hypothetical protein
MVANAGTALSQIQFSTVADIVIMWAGVAVYP